MNKKIIIGIIGVLLVIGIGAGTFFFINKGTNANNIGEDKSLNQQETEDVKQEVLEKNDKKVLVAYFS